MVEPSASTSASRARGAVPKYEKTNSKLSLESDQTCRTEGDADDENSSETQSAAVSLSTKAVRPAPQISAKASAKSGERYPSGTSGWQPPDHKKTPQQKQQLREVITACLLTQALPEKELRLLIKALQGPHHILEGMEVIRQGMAVDDDSTGLYILDTGRLSAFMCASDGNHPGSLVSTYDRRGQFFGELALIYKCPRAATVIALTESTLWSLDRESFNHLLRESCLDARKQCKACLSRISMYFMEDPHDSLADGMQLRRYEKGQLITRLRRKSSTEDGTSRLLFTVESGHAVSSTGSKRYAPADLFGMPLNTSAELEECDILAGETPTVCAVLNGLAEEKLRVFGQCLDVSQSGAPQGSDDESLTAKNSSRGAGATRSGNLDTDRSSTSWWPQVFGRCTRGNGCCLDSRNADKEALSDTSAVPQLDDEGLVVKSLPTGA